MTPVSASGVESAGFFGAGGGGVLGFSGSAGFSPRTPLIDVWIALTTVANATERVRLATNVYLLPLREPLLTARSAVTLDRLSGGRLSLGIGVGWLRPEYEALGVPWERRGKRCDEILGLLKRLWSEERIEHQGEFYQLPEVCFEPKPRQKPGIPILVGGESKPAMRRAAEHGEGWLLAWLGEVDDVKAKLGAMHALLRERGRDPAAFETSGSVSLDVDADTLRAYRDAGLSRVIVTAPALRNAEAAVDAIARFRDGPMRVV